jgi:hypothetical protein
MWHSKNFYPWTKLGRGTLGFGPVLLLPKLACTSSIPASQSHKLSSRRGQNEGKSAGAGRTHNRGRGAWCIIALHASARHWSAFTVRLAAFKRVCCCFVFSLPGPPWLCRAHLATSAATETYCYSIYWEVTSDWWSARPLLVFLCTVLLLFWVSSFVGRVCLGRENFWV